MTTTQVYCECCKSFDDTHNNSYIEELNLEICLFCFEEEHYKDTYKDMKLHI